MQYYFCFGMDYIILSQYVKFVFVQHNIRFPTLENECDCYSNILVFFFLFFPLFFVFLTGAWLENVVPGEIKHLPFLLMSRGSRYHLSSLDIVLPSMLPPTLEYKRDFSFCIRKLGAIQHKNLDHFSICAHHPCNWAICIKTKEFFIVCQNAF